MGNCGNLQYVEGGTIRGASILNSQVDSSEISNAVVKASKIEALAGVDDVSAQTIANALSALPTAQLTALASALQKATAITPDTPTEEGNAPTSTDKNSLPTVVLGDRSSLLGNPVKWIKSADGMVVPCYRGV